MGGLVIAGLPSPALAGPLAAGTDRYTTVSGKISFSQTPLPQGFFNPPNRLSSISDPFTGTVDIQGAPLDISSTAAMKVARLVKVRFSHMLPSSSGPIPIEMVALSVQSTHPITVTYGGGTSSDQWNVIVRLSQVVPQQRGEMDITRTSRDGGTFDYASLPVTPSYFFVQVGTGFVIPLDPGPTFVLSAFAIPWQDTVEKFIDAERRFCPSCSEGGGQVQSNLTASGGTVLTIKPALKLG